MKVKADFRIGQRAYDYIKKQEGTMVDKCKKLGVSKSIVYQWHLGINSPSAHHLQKLVLAGADVNYILTGIK